MYTNKYGARAYTDEYIEEHLDDFEDFVTAVRDTGRYTDLAVIATLYTSMRRI